MKLFGSKISGDKHLEVYEITCLKTHLKSCRKQPKRSPFYRLQKCGRWRPTQQSRLLAVDRPVDRPTVKFLTVVPAVDRPIDRCLANDLAVDRPVDPAISREQRLSGGRPCGRPDLGRACLCVDRLVRWTDFWIG